MVSATRPRGDEAGDWPPQAEGHVGSDDTKDQGKRPGATDAQGVEHAGGVWQDLARMEAELQDPDEEATQLYSREEVAQMVAADGRLALAAALIRGPEPSPDPAPEEPPASTTLPVDEGDEDATVHHDPDGNDETLHVDEPQDLGSTLALDADDFADLSFDEVAQAATDLAATVALDAAPAPPRAPPPPPSAPSSPGKVAVAKVALTRVTADQARPPAVPTQATCRARRSRRSSLDSTSGLLVCARSMSR